MRKADENAKKKIHSSLFAETCVLQHKQKLLSVCLFVGLFACLLVCWFVGLLACLLVCLFACLFALKRPYFLERWWDMKRQELRFVVDFTKLEQLSLLHIDLVKADGRDALIDTIFIETVGQVVALLIFAHASAIPKKFVK